MMLSRNMKIGLVIFLVLAVGAAIGLAIYFVRKDRKKDAYKQSDASGGPSPAIVLFHSRGCPHCTAILGPGKSWNKVKEMLGGSGVESYELEASHPEMQNHSVRGFPTIRFFPLGPAVRDKFLEYSGDRSPESILSFINEAANGTNNGFLPVNLAQQRGASPLLSLDASAIQPPGYGQASAAAYGL